MFHISHVQFLSFALAFVVCLLLAVFFCRKDTEVENRRKAAIKASQYLAGKGLKRLPQMLECYAVGDYSGLAKSVHSFADLVTGDPKALATEFEDVFRSELDAQLKTDAGLALIVSKLAEVKAKTNA